MTLWARIRQNSLIDGLLSLRGNARACVYTEPMFGIPYHLYMPFFSVYMYALGMDDRLIGVMTSLGLFVQIFTSIFGGIVTDRLGRKRTTLIFDIFSWTLPLLIWVFAQDYRWFFVAAIINAFHQVTNNSWNALLVEDADPKYTLTMHTWVNISGQFAVFFAPLSGLLVGRIGVVPAMRILLAIALISLTAKFIVLNGFVHETTIGEARMTTTRGTQVRHQLSGYLPVLKRILMTHQTRKLLVLFVILNMTSMISANYLSLFLTQNAGLPDAFLPIVPMVRAAIMLVFLFGFHRIIDRYNYRIPLLIGLVCCVISQALLIGVPQFGFPLLIVTIVLESIGSAIIWPQKDVLQTNWIDPHERARTVSLLYVLQLALTTPFGWLTGEIAMHSRAAVFILNSALYFICALLMIKEPHYDTQTHHL